MDIVITPLKDGGLGVLRQKAAAIHAEAVLRYIQELSCPKAQKLEMIDSLVRGEDFVTPPQVL